MALLPLPGPTVGLATNTNTPTTTYYSWFKSLFDAVKVVLSDLSAMFPAGSAVTAWTDYTPTVTASTGTFTSVSATGTYFQVGKVVFCQFTVTQTTVGTAANDLIVTVPIPPVARDQNFGGVTAGTVQFAGALRAADSKVHMRLYDGTTAIQAGRVVTASSFYEAA